MGAIYQTRHDATLASMDEPSPAQRAWLRTYLSRRDAKCVACGYSLRNAVAPRCPECGRTITATDVVHFQGRFATAIPGLAALATATAAWTGLVVSGAVWDPLMIVALWVPLLHLPILLALVVYAAAPPRTARDVRHARWLGLILGGASLLILAIVAIGSALAR
jgi:hypothetical protein